MDYCAGGKYPKPKYGYPGFWWFEYGIRDVGNMLKSLEQRGFLQMGPYNEYLDELKVIELKQLLKKFKLPVTGRKSELIDRVLKNVPEAALKETSIIRKYKLTELGKKELEDNAYVPYMHNVPDKTFDIGPENTRFNVWEINRELGRGDKSQWKDVVDRVHESMVREHRRDNQQIMEELKKRDPEGYEHLKAQDEQIELVQKAEDMYRESHDLDRLMCFWEQIWRDGGLKFEGAYWLFRLPDLYIKQKRYEEALQLCKLIKKSHPIYAYKADYYLEKLEKLMRTTKSK